MVAEEAARDAVRRASGLPGLRVGLHVVVSRGRAVLPAAEIPDLVDGEGRFRRGLAGAGARYFLLPAARRQLAAEIRAQFAAFRETGLPLDHVSVHNHMQLHPTVLGAILKAAREFGPAPVRLPYEPFLPSWRAAGEGFFRRFLSWLLLAPWAGCARFRLGRAGVPCNDYLFGMYDAGRMRKDRVLRLLSLLPPGVSELHFHLSCGAWPDPDARGYEPEGEREALASVQVAEGLREAGATAVGFRDLSGAAPE